MCKRGGRNPKVVQPDDFTGGLESCPNLGVNSGDLGGEGYRLQFDQHVLDERLTPYSDTGCTGAMNPMKELAYCDHADQMFFLARNSPKRAASTLGVNQHGGIYQESGHLLTGGPRRLRASSTSAAKSSSIGGSPFTNFRQAAPEIPRGRDGGRSSATGVPLRTISISSPAPTRFMTVEKLRATSVAVIRSTTISLSDKSDNSLARRSRVPLTWLPASSCPRRHRRQAAGCAPRLQPSRA
jgi:hypothetical protein